MSLRLRDSRVLWSLRWSGRIGLGASMDSALGDMATPQ